MRDKFGLAVASYGFLVPFNTTVTIHRFAELIRNTYSNPQSEQLAAELDKVTGEISHDYRGVHAIIKLQEVRF